MNAATLPGDSRLTLDRLAAAATLLAPFVVALTVGGVVLTATGRDAIETYRLLFEQAFGGRIAFANTLVATTPILLAGLATAVAFRAGVFTIGVEGSLYLGAFTSAWVGFTFTGLAGALLVPVALGAAAVAGALWSAPPAALRAWLGVDEVVSTLMLNYVAVLLTSYLVNEHFLAPGVANSMSPLVADQARLQPLLARTQLTVAFLIALAGTAIVALVFRSTPAGYDLRLAGLAPRFAAVTGISLAAVVIGAMLASGLLGGLAGGLQVLGVNYRFIDRFSPGYGFTGIAVALLGRNTPLGVLLAALFFGALANGGAMIQLFSDIPIDLINLLQGLVMILAVMQFARFRRRATAGA